MTRARNDEYSTEFRLWIREQKEIDSKKGFVATDVDLVWERRSAFDVPEEWMVLEEKRYGYEMTPTQARQLKRLDACLRADVFYCGAHFLKFENTDPDDGRIWLDDREITRADLIEFLRFEKGPDWYVSYFAAPDGGGLPRAGAYPGVDYEREKTLPLAMRRMRARNRGEVEPTV